MKYSLSEIKTPGIIYTIPYNIVDNILIVSKSIDGFVNTKKLVKGEDYIYTEQPEKRDNWDILRNFNSTKFDEIVNPNIDIKGKINKITENNYIDTIGNIIEYILSQPNQEELVEHMLDIFSKNSFFSKIYAKCVVIMNDNISCVNECIHRRINNILCIYETFEYVTDKQYEKFCANTKLNEERKSIGLFYANISIHGSIFPKKMIADIIDFLLEKVIQLVKNENKKNEIDEMVENIFILCKCLVESGYSINNEKIEILSVSSPKIEKGLTNKTIFRFIDIVELVA